MVTSAAARRLTRPPGRVAVKGSSRALPSWISASAACRCRVTPPVTQRADRPAQVAVGDPQRLQRQRQVGDHAAVAAGRRGRGRGRAPRARPAAAAAHRGRCGCEASVPCRRPAAGRPHRSGHPPASPAEEAKRSPRQEGAAGEAGPRSADPGIRAPGPAPAAAASRPAAPARPGPAPAAPGQIDAASTLRGSAMPPFRVAVAARGGGDQVERQGAGAAPASSRAGAPRVPSSRSGTPFSAASAASASGWSCRGRVAVRRVSRSPGSSASSAAGAER